MLQRIVEKINAKGWNVYHTESIDTIHESVPRGPVSKLEVGKQYSAFPIVSNPNDIQQMINSLQYMAQSRTVPSIIFNGKPMLLGMFYVDESEIDIRAIGGGHLSYTDFLGSLDTLEAFINQN